MTLTIILFKMSLFLTLEQEVNLKKIEQEQQNKVARREKNKHVYEKRSIETGIPLNLIDLDVIKIGTFLGLIKKKELMYDKTYKFIDIIFDNQEPIHRPLNFKQLDKLVTENDKIEYQQKCVSQQSFKFYTLMQSYTSNKLKFIQQHVNIDVPTDDIESFKDIIVATIDVFVDEIEESEPVEKTNLWYIIKQLRSILLGLMNIEEYKKLVCKHVKLFYNDESFSDLERLIIMHQPPTHLAKEDVTKLLQELWISRFKTNPQLVVFDTNMIKKCLIPSLLVISIQKVLSTILISPYHNAIGYLNIADGRDKWSFFTLKSIENKTRLWVVDNGLHFFTQYVINNMTTYITHLFRTYYKAVFGHHRFVNEFWCNNDIFKNLLSNIVFITDYVRVNKMLKKIVQCESIIPTEYDFFNHLVYFDTHTHYATSVYVFTSLITKLFDRIDKTQIQQIYKIHCL